MQLLVLAPVAVGGGKVCREQREHVGLQGKLHDDRALVGAQLKEKYGKTWINKKIYQF